MTLAGFFFGLQFMGYRFAQGGLIPFLNWRILLHLVLIELSLSVIRL